MKIGAIFDANPGHRRNITGAPGGPTIQQDILRIGTILGKKIKRKGNILKELN